MKMILIVGLAMIGIGVAAVQAGGLACAVDVALQEKQGGYVEWTGHKFKVQPVEMTQKEKKSHELNGSLVYFDGKKDETITYRVSKQGSKVDSIEVQINGGMWLPLSADLTKALGDYCKTGNVNDEKQGNIHQALYKAAKDGKQSWSRTAELIVALIAIRHC
jgi:hypothetical protein